MRAAITAKLSGGLAKANAKLGEAPLTVAAALLLGALAFLCVCGCCAFALCRHLCRRGGHRLANADEPIDELYGDESNGRGHSLRKGRRRRGGSAPCRQRIRTTARTTSSVKLLYMRREDVEDVVRGFNVEQGQLSCQLT